ncbi:MAG: YfhO family protein [Anaerolineae bacterium]
MSFRIESSRWAVFWPYLFLAGLIVLFFNRMVFTDLILARGDTFLYFYPYWQMAADALRAGEIPFWNPHIFMGAPLLANSQVGFFYPPNWLFWLAADPPQAVKLAIVSHLVIGAWGLFRLAHKRLEMSLVAGLLSAVVFALGGYLTAQVEHVNQLEGLAWLPWLLVVVDGFAVRGWHKGATALKSGHVTQASKPLYSVVAVAGLFTLQILAGHTQTVFLSGAACGLWLFAGALQPNLTIKQRLWPLLFLGGGAVLALLISAAQLIPTYELTQLSSRQGGLTTAEVLSFSWHPLLATQSLLPTIGQAGFTEYVAFIPLTALFLAIWALIIGWKDGLNRMLKHKMIQPILLTGTGLFLALGRFNLISWYYSRLPGFDLFRVPARWLILYAIGIALLAGFGLDRLGQGKRKQLNWAVLAYFLLLLWNPASVYLSQWVPVGPESSLDLLNSLSLIALTLELISLVLIWVWIDERKQKVQINFSAPQWVLFALAVAFLFIATRSLPYNRLTTPEAYIDLRPAGLRLQADAHSQIVPDRFISLSDIFFDPGDQAEIDTIYASKLSEQALYDYTVSIKLKEIVSPNFPMVYGLASLDGFDGGILPLKSYSTLMSQTILPDGRVTTDGRLREHLDVIPSAEWLDRFNVRYVITDKVGDVWVDDVFFDRQHVTPIAPFESVEIGYLPDFLADEIQLLAEQPLGKIEIAWSDGTTVIQPAESADIPGLWTARLPQQTVLEAVEIFAGGDFVELTAVSLVNAKEGWFKAVTPGQYRLIHSGDVKIYENLDVWPRAFFLNSDSQSVMGADRIEGHAEIVSYAAERVELNVETAEDARLVLSDAVYPGWTVTVDGAETEILEVDGLLRGVELAAGEHKIIFQFRPVSFQIGLAVSMIMIIILAGVLVFAYRRELKKS